MKSFGTTIFSLVFSTGMPDAQPVRSRYVNAGPDKLTNEAAGAGFVMILIHDGAVHTRRWNYQLTEFSKSFKVIRYDRRGYGNSTAPTVAHFARGRFENPIRSVEC